MAVLQLAAHIQGKPLEDSHPSATPFVLYMTCSPPRAFCEVSHSLGQK